MLSPVVQRLVGAACASVCALAASAIIGGVIMYGDVQAIHARLDVGDARDASQEESIMYLSRRMTEHQIDHE